MSVPPPRRRVKVAPKYIGVSVNTNRIVIPANVKANERVLENWQDPTTDSITGADPETPESSSSENDSEASTSEEDRDLEASEAETGHESDTPSSQSLTEHLQMLPSSQPTSSPIKPASLTSVSSQPLPSEPVLSQPESSQPASTASRPRKVRSVKRGPLDFELDFADLIFESDLTGELTNWQAGSFERRVVHLDRSLEDEAVSIWITSEQAKAQCSVSCLFDPGSKGRVLTLYDFQRLVAFIAGRPLDEAAKRKVKGLASKFWQLEQVTAEDPLFSRVMDLEDPKPFVRRGTFWTLNWEDVEPALVRVFESSGVIVTVL